MYEKPAHCVSVTRMFCCVMEKSLQRTSLRLSQWLSWCCLCGRSRLGPKWSSETLSCDARNILSKLDVNVWGSLFLREFCAEGHKIQWQGKKNHFVELHKRMIQSCAFLSPYHWQTWLSWNTNSGESNLNCKAIRRNIINCNIKCVFEFWLKITLNFYYPLHVFVLFSHQNFSICRVCKN